jgi:hypothetical protein
VQPAAQRVRQHAERQDVGCRRQLADVGGFQRLADGDALHVAIECW